MSRGEAQQPLRFPDGLPRLHCDRRVYPMGVEDRAQIRREEVPAQRTEPSFDDPRVLLGVKGPEVLMGVDLHRCIVRGTQRPWLVDS